MEKKLYVKPAMRVKPIRISNLICAASLPYGFQGIQSRSSVVGDDVPDYDGDSSGNLWDDAN